MDTVTDDVERCLWAVADAAKTLKSEGLCLPALIRLDNALAALDRAKSARGPGRASAGCRV